MIKEEIVDTAYLESEGCSDEVLFCIILPQHYCDSHVCAKKFRNEKIAEQDNKNKTKTTWTCGWRSYCIRMYNAGKYWIHREKYYS